jgi:hypothetical protein
MTKSLSKRSYARKGASQQPIVPRGIYAYGATQRIDSLGEIA